MSGLKYMEDATVFLEKILISSDKNIIKEYKPVNFRNICQKTSTGNNLCYFDVENLLYSSHKEKPAFFVSKSVRKSSKFRKKLKLNSKYENVELSCFKNNKNGEYILFITQNLEKTKSTIYLSLSQTYFRKLDNKGIKTSKKSKIIPKNYKKIIGFNNIFEKSLKKDLKLCLPCSKDDVSVTAVFHTKNNKETKNFMVHEINTKNDVQKFVKILENLNTTQIKLQNQDFPIKNILLIVILNRSKTELYLEEKAYTKKFQKSVKLDENIIELDNKRYINVKLLNIKLNYLKWCRTTKMTNNPVESIASEYFDSKSITRAESFISIVSYSSFCDTEKSIKNVEKNFGAINSKVEKSHNILCNLPSNISDDHYPVYQKYFINQNYFRNILSKIGSRIKSVCSLFSDQNEKFYVDIVNRNICNNRCDSSLICQQINLTKVITNFPSNMFNRKCILSKNESVTIRNKQKPKKVITTDLLPKSSFKINEKNSINDLLKVKLKLLSSPILAPVYKKQADVNLQDIQLMLGNILSINKKISNFADFQKDKNIFGLTKPKEKVFIDPKRPQNIKKIRKNKNIKVFPPKDSTKINVMDNSEKKQILIPKDNESGLQNNVKKLKNILHGIEKKEHDFISPEAQKSLKDICFLLENHVKDDTKNVKTQSREEMRRKLSNNLIKLKNILEEKKLYKNVASQVNIAPQKIEIIVKSKSNNCVSKIHKIKSKGICKLEDIKIKIEKHLEKMKDKLKNKLNFEITDSTGAVPSKNKLVHGKINSENPIKKSKTSNSKMKSNRSFSYIKSSSSGRLKQIENVISSNNINKSTVTMQKQSLQNLALSSKENVKTISKLTPKNSTNNNKNVKPLKNNPKATHLQEDVKPRKKIISSKEINIKKENVASLSKSKISLEKLDILKEIILQSQNKRITSSKERQQQKPNKQFLKRKGSQNGAQDQSIFFLNEDNTLSSQENLCPPQKISSMKINFILNPKENIPISNKNIGSSSLIKQKCLSNSKNKLQSIINFQNEPTSNSKNENNLSDETGPEKSSEKRKTGENLIKFFESENFSSDKLNKQVSDSEQSLSDFKETIFIEENKRKNIEQKFSNLIRENSKNSKQEKQNGAKENNKQQNRGTDCFDLISSESKTLTETKETSCDDLEVDEILNESRTCITALENKMHNQDKSLNELITISQKMEENLTKKKTELSNSIDDMNSVSKEKNVPENNIQKGKKFDFVQMKAELLSLITEVKDKPQLDKKYSQENIRSKIEENLMKLSNIIQAFKEDKKQKLLTPDVQGSLKKLGIIPEENQELVTQKSSHKMYVNIIPKTKEERTEIEKKIILFRNMHETLEKIAQKMEKNSLIISQVSDLKRELRKILGIQETIKPKSLETSSKCPSRTSSRYMENPFIKTKQEIAKNIQNSLLLLKNLNEVVGNSKRNPENVMKQLAEIELALIAQTGKLYQRRVYGHFMKHKKSKSNTHLRTTDIGSKVAVTKSKASVTMPFIKSTHHVDTKAKKLRKHEENGMDKNQPSKKVAMKSSTPKSNRRNICSPIAKTRSRSARISRKVSSNSRKENYVSPVVESSQQLKLFKIYRPSKSKFCLQVEPDISDVPLNHLTPFRSEYPRKDHLSNIEVEDTYLYKLVNNLLGNEIIEPLVKCGDIAKSAYAKKRSIRKMEPRSQTMPRKVPPEKREEGDILYYKPSWDKRAHKNLFIEPPTPPPTPDIRYGGIRPVATIFALDKLVSEALKFHPRYVQTNMKDLLRGVTLDKNLKPRNISARNKVRTPTFTARSRIRTPNRLNRIQIEPKIQISSTQRKSRVKPTKKKKKDNVSKKKCVKNIDVHFK